MTQTQVALTAVEEQRFNELLKASYRKVFNMAYRLSGSRSDAEDLTQESFFRAYRSFHEFEGDRPFENWIFRILSRLFLDLLRNRRRRIQAVSYDAPLPREGDDALYFDMADSRPNPEQTLIENSFAEDLAKAMEYLTPEQRMLVALADIEGVPYKDIADIIGKPVGTVRSRLHRTHKFLRAKIEEIRRSEVGSRKCARSWHLAPQP